MEKNKGDDGGMKRRTMKSMGGLRGTSMAAGFQKTGIIPTMKGPLPPSSSLPLLPSLPSPLARKWTPCQPAAVAHTQTTELAAEKRFVKRLISDESSLNNVVVFLDCLDKGNGCQRLRFPAMASFRGETNR